MSDFLGGQSLSHRSRASPTLTLRPMSLIDVHNIAEQEKKLHGIHYKDDEFEVEGVDIPDYAVTAEHLQHILDSWKERGEKGRERLNVVCQGAQPVAAFHYTFTRNPVTSVPELVLHWLQVQVKAPTAAYLKVMDWLEEVARQSIDDVEMTYIVPDARSYDRTVGFMVSQGKWKMELLRDHFPRNVDGWQFTLNVKGTPRTKSDKK